MKYLYLLVAAILLQIFDHAPAEPPHSSTNIEEQVDTFVAELPDEFNGTILLAVGDSILMNKGYGFANRSHMVPNTANTVYQLASVSKDFTTILVFKFVEMGLIDLNATIDTYLPEYPKDKASKITIHHLLLHRSGIKHHFQAIPDFLGHHDLLYHTQREFLGLFWNADLAHEPGQGTTYTSPGYSILTFIMERVTGKSFAELLKEHIIQPLGLENTFVDNNLTAFDNLAVGYRKGINGLVFDLEEVPSNFSGAGDMLSTAKDLYKFQRILSTDNDLVLTKPYKEMLFEEQYRINEGLVRANVATLAKHYYNNHDDTLTQYGIGTGGSYGFQARLTRFLEIDACYIVLSNVRNDRAMNEQMFSFLQDLLCEITGIPLKKYYLLSPHAPLQIPLDIPPEQLSLFEGIYKSDDGEFYQVFPNNGKLYYRDYSLSFWNWPNAYGGELLSMGDGTFVDNNTFLQRYFIFVVPNRLTPNHPYAGLKDLFTDTTGGDAYQLAVVKFGYPSRALRWISEKDGPDLDLEEYQGSYYSEELQQTFQFTIDDGQLMASDFIGFGDLFCTALESDLFISEAGYLVFHRYDDGTIRDFWLMSENLDHVCGSLFVKK